MVVPSDLACASVSKAEAVGSDCFYLVTDGSDSVCNSKDSQAIRKTHFSFSDFRDMYEFNICIRVCKKKDS